MSEPIVIELQRLASEKSTDISDLLRKALVVATKLRVNDFKAWINQELNGYDDRKSIPDYRRIPIQLKFVDRWRGGLIPMVFGDSELEQILCSFPMHHSISELNLLTTTSGMFHLSVSGGEHDYLTKLFRQEFPMQIVREGARSSVVAIIDSVRNTILEWALRLEDQGILGEGMTFSKEEREKAMTSPSIHIGSFQGVLGDVTGSTVSQDLNMSVKKGDINSLNQSLASAGISLDDILLLKTAIETDPTPKSSSEFGPKISSWIGTMIAKSASGAWKVTVEAAEKLIRKAIAAYYGFGD